MLFRSQVIRTTPYSECEHHRSSSDALYPATDIEQILVGGRSAEIGGRFDGVDVRPESVDHRLRIGESDRPPVLGDGNVEVEKVVDVEDDVLSIDFSPSHPQRMAERKILAIHSMVPFLNLIRPEDNARWTK